MSNTLARVKLGELIAHRNGFITIQDDAKYKRCRVQIHAQGIVLRDEVTGFEIRTKKQQVCKANDFLVAEIDAKVGGYGIVPGDLDGAIVSSHYFLYEIDKCKLMPKYLEYFSKTKHFQDQVLAHGSTNYAAIRPGHVLNYTIPLPSLREQQTIVTQIENILQRLNEVHKLQEVTQKEINALWNSLCVEAFKKAENYRTKSLTEVAVLERGKFSYRPRNSPMFFGGDHPWIQISEIESANKYITRWTQTLNEEGLAISKKFAKGTLLVSIAATIGAVGILDFDCCVPDSIVGVTPKKGTHGEYVYYFFTYLRSHLEKIAPESARKNINLEILSSIKIPTPPLEEQVRITEYLNQIRTGIDKVENLGFEIAAKQEAVLPSILSRMFKGNSL